MYASLWQRLFSFFVDTIVINLINLSVFLIAGGFLRLLYISKIYDPSIITGNILFIRLMELLILLITPWVYMAWFESSNKQASFGKICVGLIVTDSNLNRITFIRATVRHFSKALSVLSLFIGFLMIVFTHRKQALHDLISNCVVIDKDKRYLLDRQNENANNVILDM